jgi:hypothetical protein
MRILVLLTLVLAACGGNQAPGRGNMGNTQNPGDDPPVMMSDPCDACGAHQGCTNGTCVDLPQKCPCPKESYCDLTTNMCKAGCVSDGDCNAGRICNDQRKCVTGCRKDGDCASGQICDASSQTCRKGCRNDGQCGAGAICDDAKLICRNGCRDDNDCSGLAGIQICDDATLVCRAGCNQRSDCGPTEYCDLAARACKSGCQYASDCTAPAGATCTAGKCVCPTGQTDCSGTCVDLKNDKNNCNTCGNICKAPAYGTAYCSAGVCKQSCPINSINCNGQCCGGSVYPEPTYCCMNSYCLKAGYQCF